MLGLGVDALMCKNCSKNERRKPVSECGCCGIFIHSTLGTSKFDHPCDSKIQILLYIPKIDHQPLKNVILLRRNTSMK